MASKRPRRPSTRRKKAYTPPDFRRFNGRRYVLAGSNRKKESKSKARKGAAVARAKGWNARVVQAGRSWWVYTRSRK